MAKSVENLLISRKPRKFPNDLFFRTILENAWKYDHAIIHDKTLGIDANYAQLLTDVLHMIQRLREKLESTLLGDDQVISESKPYIFIAAPVDYEFIVATIAILAIGAAFVPLSKDVSSKQAFSLSQKCQSSYILVGSRNMQQARDIQKFAEQNEHSCRIELLSISVKNPAPSNTSALNLQIEENLLIEPSRPGMITFSSGTSGSPGIIVHARRFFYRPMKTPVRATLLLTADPMHWISSLNTMVIPLLSGCKGEILDPTSGPAVFWERLRKGGISSLTSGPPFWENMARHYQNHIANLPAEERAQYVRGIQAPRLAYITGTVANSKLFKFWDELDRPLLAAYGGSEIGGVALTGMPGANAHENRCIGKPLPHVTIKLSKGDHGELLIKTAHLMTGYLDNPQKTEASFDLDGFYKTGDEAHLVNDEYVLDGRISSDFLETNSSRISVLDLETEIMRLPFTSEVYALPIALPEQKPFIGVLTRIQRPGFLALSSMDEEPQSLLDECLPSLEEALRTISRNYQVPAALHILRKNDVLSRKRGGNKVQRQETAAIYFSAEKVQNLEFDFQVGLQ